jgi:hypothetical protein
MARHVVDHTRLIERECARIGLPFIDMAGDFDQKLDDAQTLIA